MDQSKGFRSERIYNRDGSFAEFKISTVDGIFIGYSPSLREARKLVEEFIARREDHLSRPQNRWELESKP